MLEVKNIDVFYGSIRALKDVSFSVEKGEIVSIIGANGAGKSTTLRAISGILRATSGTIIYDGHDITHTPPHLIARMGISQVPEGRGIFGNLTVQENLDVALSSVKDKRSAGPNQDKVFSLFPRLKERRRQISGTLSGGEQQMLAVGRGLMQNNPFLLLDEPSMGLSPVLVEEIFGIIVEINQLGKTVLLVEQNAFKALSIAHRAYVLETGSLVLSGTAKELRDNPDVKKAYLGG
ncbi:MAG TPA: ABC transporter ATP-binding protein [Candidatus Deferrimicrobium sp.]|nr:ABC transporter ATP-binding protein [Candidatus Deferrimicrobium sp.]